MSKYYRRPQLAALEQPSRTTLLKKVPWRFLLCSAIIALSLTYLWLVNGSAARGFYLTSLEQQEKQLNITYDKYERELAEAQSLERLEASAKELGLVPVTHVEYVDAAASTALR